MKRLFAVLVCAFSLSAQAQEVTMVKVDKELEMTKTELYAKAKMFVSDVMKDAKKAITNDDKENGIIQFNVTTVINKMDVMIPCTYTYTYKVRIRMKDNKYRIEVYDCECVDAYMNNQGRKQEVPKIAYFEGDGPKIGAFSKGVKQKAAKEMMDELRKQAKSICTSFEKQVLMEDDF